MTLAEFGDVLREAREQRGLSANEMASRLKISVSMVHSIENGVLDALPHSVYARGFIKAYASLVGISPDVTLEALGPLTPGEEPVLGPARRFDAPARRVMPSLDGRSAAFLGSLAVVLVVLTGLFTFREALLDKTNALLFGARLEQSVAEPATPAAPASSVASPKADAARDGQTGAAPAPQSESSRITAAQSEPAPTPQTEAERAAPPDTAGFSGAAVDIADSADAPAPAAARVPAPEKVTLPVVAGGRLPGQALDASSERAEKKPETFVQTDTPAKNKGAAPHSGRKYQLVVTGLEPAWISVRPVNGTPQNAELRKGQVFSVELDRPFALRLGNAGGVRIQFNGKTLPSAGYSGQVMTLKFPR